MTKEMIPSLSLIWVGIGGGIGAMLRYYLGEKIRIYYQGYFPLANFVINVSGAFILAFLSVLLSIHWQMRYGTILQELLLTGILGGYTTFSAMQLDALKLFEKEKSVLGLFYLIMSVISGLIGAAFGVILAKMI